MATTITVPSGPIDCACVIHGDTYNWTYVERLYNMLNRHISAGVRLHVYTEADRPVPAPMIKHELDDWKIAGPKMSWWYKMQLFNTKKFAGPLLYFDLDVVIVNNIDWITQASLRWFWSVRDFRYLWRPHDLSINSSVMWWDNQNTQQVWQAFCQQKLDKLVKSYKGDQDFLKDHVPQEICRYFNHERVLSWRWQCKDGGYDFKTRRFFQPDTETKYSENASVLVFHGRPKPAEINDVVISNHWN